MKVIEVTVRPTQRLCRACAAFGLAVRRVRAGRGVTGGDARAAGRLLGAMPEGSVGLISGPSGSGKSTLLRAVAREGAGRGWRVVLVPRAWEGPDRAVIDLIPGALGEAIATLARAGLGDATLLGRRPRELSEGERLRLLLAASLARARRDEHHAPVLLIIDEFAGSLDRPTARTLSRSLARWARREGARVVCATAHDDVGEWLDPSARARLSLGEHAHAARSA